MLTVGGPLTGLLIHLADFTLILIVASETTENPNFMLSGTSWKCIKSFSPFSTSTFLETLTHRTCMDQFLHG